MDRRAFVGDLTACAALFAVSRGPFDPPLVGSASRWLVMTDQACGGLLRALLPGSQQIELAANELLAPVWRPPYGSKRALGIVGAANTVLLLEVLRDWRAAVRYAGRDAGVAALHSGLPAVALGATTNDRAEFIVADLT